MLLVVKTLLNKGLDKCITYSYKGGETKHYVLTVILNKYEDINNICNDIKDMFPFKKSFYVYFKWDNTPKYLQNKEYINTILDIFSMDKSFNSYHEHIINDIINYILKNKNNPHITSQKFSNFVRYTLNHNIDDDTMTIIVDSLKFSKILINEGIDLKL